jgi:hypothetical protein
MTQENPLETLAFMTVIQTLKTSKKCSSKTRIYTCELAPGAGYIAPSAGHKSTQLHQLKVAPSAAKGGVNPGLKSISCIFRVLKAIPHQFVNQMHP